MTRYNLTLYLLRSSHSKTLLHDFCSHIILLEVYMHAFHPKSFTNSSCCPVQFSNAVLEIVCSWALKLSHTVHTPCSWDPIVNFWWIAVTKIRSISMIQLEEWVNVSPNSMTAYTFYAQRLKKRKKEKKQLNNNFLSFTSTEWKW